MNFPKKKKERNLLIDSIRGIAFILMIIHHIYYFRIFTFLPVIIPRWVQICGTISRNIFIILNGYVSNKYNSKPLDIFINACIITLYSYIFLPRENVIYMGVLHYLFLSSFILNKLKNRYAEMIFVMGLLSFYNKTTYFHIKSNPADIFMPHIWFYKSVIGFALGYLILDKLNLNLNLNLNSENLHIYKLGKHSLSLYTVHMCIFMYFQNRF